MTDKELQKHIEYLNEHFPTDHDELNFYSNLLMKFHIEYESRKKECPMTDKMILQSLINHLKNRLVDEFNKNGFFTPFCLSLQENLFTARELQCSLDKTSNILEMAMLTFTMSFNFGNLQEEEETTEDEIDTSCIVFDDDSEQAKKPVKRVEIPPPKRFNMIDGNIIASIGYPLPKMNPLNNGTPE